MSAKLDIRAEILSAVLLLLITCPLLAQRTSAQRLNDAFALEVNGKPAQAVVELQELLNTGSLDALRLW